MGFGVVIIVLGTIYTLSCCANICFHILKYNLGNFKNKALLKKARQRPHLGTKTSPILFHQGQYQTQVKQKPTTGEQGQTDKDSPWAQVSSFVTLFSEREEVFPLKCFLNTIT